MNNIIYILSGILVLLSLQLIIRTVKRQKKEPVNIWETPIPQQNKNWHGKATTLQAPPSYMFRQR